MCSPGGLRWPPSACGGTGCTHNGGRYRSRSSPIKHRGNHTLPPPFRPVCPFNPRQPTAVSANHDQAPASLRRGLANREASRLRRFPLEVCKEFLERFYSSLIAKGVDFSQETIENELISICLDSKGKENRLCYYLGATNDAATKILSEVTRPMSAHVPAIKICEKLKRIDSQICELKYEKKLDLESVDLSKMRVAELKKILNSWGEECKACIEKADLVDLIKKLAPKYTSESPRSDL